MQILITGPLHGDTERLNGLIEVSQPQVVFIVGPLKISQPIKLNLTWFFVRGKEDSLAPLLKSNGIDMLSRIFQFGNGLTFAGISGIYHPSTVKLTRREWIKSRGKMEKHKQNYLFKEDIDSLIQTFRNSGLERLDMLFIADSPTKQIFKEIIELVKPKYLFFPSNSYIKEKAGKTTFIGLENITSPRGKYILHL
jgi:hypothetical protein